VLSTKVDLRKLFACELSCSARTCGRTTDCRRILEHILEVGRASRKNDPVSRYLLAGAGDSDVGESLVVEEIDHVPSEMLRLV
jgi:hypothetical protein